ncbi:GntR family transcriptional regulator [Halomonas salipaludis]|uniref:GntR family transcriptional regulator n=1 Tax=Halomonas salipaludis TaxID=2032625 RepID=A0A2A2ESH8_9GAMM|nr:GntR family transcriptional regulator [Halomonas salipaludis]PAU75339.1 GntR family transcriptional regulator [Halomonas salipaludis]
MSKHVRFDKKQQVLTELMRRIESGQLGYGKRLPGEHQLANEFKVSRGTLRQALSELKEQHYIATQTGVGSIVTYDGIPLDQQRGWAQALADSGATLETQLLRLESIEDEALAATYGMAAYIAVERRRVTSHGLIVSLERSRIPATPVLHDLPQRGLLDNSLTATLKAAGLHAEHGEQSVDVVMLDAEDARLLGRKTGSPFLRSVRTTFDQREALVEHVVSLLDPDHFRLYLRFGT